MTRTQDFRTFSAHVLPERPHLDHLRAEAKRRHAVLKAVAHSAQLADAQLLVARGSGCSSWMALKVEVDRRRLLCGAADIPVMAVMRPPRERQPESLSEAREYAEQMRVALAKEARPHPRCAASSQEGEKLGAPKTEALGVRSLRGQMLL